MCWCSSWLLQTIAAQTRLASGSGCHRQAPRLSAAVPLASCLTCVSSISKSVVTPAPASVRHKRLMFLACVSTVPDCIVQRGGAACKPWLLLFADWRCTDVLGPHVPVTAPHLPSKNVTCAVTTNSYAYLCRNDTYSAEGGYCCSRCRNTGYALLSILSPPPVPVKDMILNFPVLLFAPVGFDLDT